MASGQCSVLPVFILAALSAAIFLFRAPFTRMAPDPPGLVVATPSILLQEVRRSEARFAKAEAQPQLRDCRIAVSAVSATGIASNDASETLNSKLRTSATATLSVEPSRRSTGWLSSGALNFQVRIFPDSALTSRRRARRGRCPSAGQDSILTTRSQSASGNGVFCEV